MHFVEYSGINAFLIGLSKVLLKDGVQRFVRGQICYELPDPIIVKISNPRARIVSIPERKWSYTLPYAESLWIASGRNDIDLVSHYIKRMGTFSDDGKYMRAAYGPRIRSFTGVKNDYRKSYIGSEKNDSHITEVDQLRYVIEAFKKDLYTRQAIITIGDPSKDLFEDKNILKSTKDFPCTCSLHFLKTNGKLDLTVHMRSNDFIWGASAVNIFNFTFMQEYVAQILNLEIGSYYHVVNNLHYYENFKSLVETLASIDNVVDEYHVYEKKFNSLDEFDEKVNLLEHFENETRTNINVPLIDLGDDFFNDWAKIFYHYNIDKTFNSFSSDLLSKTVKKFTPAI